MDSTLSKKVAESKKINTKRLKEIFSSRETGINNPRTYGCTMMVLGEYPQLVLSLGWTDHEPCSIFSID
jgi:hypothetical protein